MNNLVSIIFILVIFIIIYFSGRFLHKFEDTVEQEVYIDSPECSPAISSCRAVFDGGEISVHFLQKPSALTPFDVELLTKNFDAAEITATFVMNNMDMGINAFSLVHQSKDAWRVKAILPICSLARSDWVVELRVKYKNKILRTDYSFE